MSTCKRPIEDRKSEAKNDWIFGGLLFVIGIIAFLIFSCTPNHTSKTVYRDTLEPRKIIIKP